MSDEIELPHEKLLAYRLAIDLMKQVQAMEIADPLLTGLIRRYGNETFAPRSSAPEQDPSTGSGAGPSPSTSTTTARERDRNENQN